MLLIPKLYSGSFVHSVSDHCGILSPLCRNPSVFQFDDRADQVSHHGDLHSNCSTCCTQQWPGNELWNVNLCAVSSAVLQNVILVCFCWIILEKLWFDLFRHCHSSLILAVGCPTSPSLCNNHLPPLRGSVLRAPCWRPSLTSIPLSMAWQRSTFWAHSPLTLWVYEKLFLKMYIWR